MRRFRQTFPWTLGLALLIALAAACARKIAPPPAPAEPPAQPPAKLVTREADLARQTMDFMGGARALKQIRFLRFDFVIEKNKKRVTHRSHWWDRRSGRYRLDIFEEGEPITFLMNVKEKTGMAYIKHRPVGAERQAMLMNKAWDYFRMDTAWLLGGARLTASGTRLEFQGLTLLASRYVNKLAATFSDDETPSARDRYWFYLDPASGQPYAWALVQEGFNRQPDTFRWARWERLDKLALPVEFEEIGGPRRVRIENLSTFEVVGESIFDKP